MKTPMSEHNVTDLVIMVILMVLLIPLPLMLLWNGLLPGLFGLQTIGYLQAMGLYILGTIFFKG